MWLEPRERRLIIILCFVGAIRVLVFSAAFPPFHPVDEPFHFDLVVKYSHGHVPYRLANERLSVETRDAITLYGTGISNLNGQLVLHDSPEYMSPKPVDGVPRPAWTAPEAVHGAMLAHGREFWNVGNHEATEPPVYYVVAGAWHRLGKAIGLDGGHAFYWTRLLNSALYAGVVWLTYLFAREVCPGNRFFALSVTVLAAIFPQDSFYGVSNDGPLAPLLFAAALYCLLRVMVSPRSWVQYAGTGLLVAMTLLTKYSNVAVVGALLITVVASRSASARPSRADAEKLAILVFCAVTPVAMWFTRSYLLSGDLTGSQQKYQMLGWTLKSLGAIRDHPFFGASALDAFVRDFLHGVVATLWRGEIMWHGMPRALRSVDLFYSISSALFLAFALIRARSARDPAERAAIWTGAATVIFAIGSLAVLSIMFDFGERQTFPSTRSPYFTSGRLIVGTLAPFLTLYVYGLEWGLSKARIPGALVPVVVGIALLVLASQTILAFPVSQSEYNWFSLLQAVEAGSRFP
jgi:predicted membrane protein DUF2142